MPLSGWSQREVECGLERNGGLCNGGCSLCRNGGGVHDRCSARSVTVVLTMENFSGVNGDNLSEL